MHSIIAILALAGSVVAQTSSVDCIAAYNSCRSYTGTVSPNQAQCAADYAGCLGYNPFTSAAATGTAYRPRPTGTAVTVTTVVCPSSTTFVCDSSTYAVSTPTTLTLTCGNCAITPVMTTAPGAATTGAVTTKSGPTPTTTPKPYEGSADRLQVGGALVAAAIGLMAL